MKKTFRLFGIFALMLSVVTMMSSCKKDMSNLPGRWVATVAVIDDDDEDDLDDVWTFNTDGTCNIQCDLDEYFDNIQYDLVTFNGTYTTESNKKLTITSNHFNEGENGYYEQIVYNLNILSLTKNTMMVSGTVRLSQYSGSGFVNKKEVDATITLTK
jgi:hypothetical protein